MAASKASSAYAAAGVDIDVMMEALRKARRDIRTTYTEDVLGDVGSFGGLFRSPGRDAARAPAADGTGRRRSCRRSGTTRCARAR